MNGELLELLELEDIKGSAHELAEVIGLEAFRKLVRVYGGTDHLYVPQADMLLIPVRDAMIQRAFDGGNYVELAQQWGITTRRVRDIVREQAEELRRKPMDGQLSLF